MLSESLQHVEQLHGHFDASMAPAEYFVQLTSYLKCPASNGSPPVHVKILAVADPIDQKVDSNLVI